MHRIDPRLAIALGAALWTTKVSAQRGRIPLGVAITPRNFPNHSPAEIDEAFRLAREIGSHAVLIEQWGSLNISIVKLLLAKARHNKLTPILGLSPTTLDQQRKELDVPNAVRQRARRRVSFSNPEIRTAFIEASKELARLEPPYLCLATEINFLAMQRLEEFLHFVTLYKEAYRAAKAISPTTKVFVSFQWDWMRIVDAKEPKRIAEHSKVVNIFRPELDLIALTTYPAPHFRSVQELPADYYTSVFRHIPRNEPVMLMEIGWPTTGTSSSGEQQQAAFIQRLPELLRGINLIGVEWALLHDVKLSEFGADLSTVGLRSRSGDPKSSFNAFRNLTLP